MPKVVSVRPNLEVAELEEAVEFLRSVLGFDVEVDAPEFGLVLLQRDGVGLAVLKAADPAVNETTACYLGVEGVAELHATCTEHAGESTSALIDHPWGLRDFVVELPGGHKLAFGERIA